MLSICSYFASYLSLNVLIKFVLKENKCNHGHWVCKGVSFRNRIESRSFQFFAFVYIRCFNRLILSIFFKNEFLFNKNRLYVNALKKQGSWANLCLLQVLTFPIKLQKKVLKVKNALENKVSLIISVRYIYCSCHEMKI